jgi:hypothetical protein
MPLFIVAVALFIVAAIVATGVRWTPLLAALMGLGTLIRRSIHPTILRLPPHASC